jgi:hypothetical protein
MENIEILINNEDQVFEESKKVINQMIDHASKIIEETTDEGQTTTENQIDEGNIEKNDDGIVPFTTSESNEEQENPTDQNTTTSSQTLVPLKEVNDRKREFNNEDDNERIGDQTKKVKIVEKKEPENNIIINDISSVEVL